MRWQKKTTAIENHKKKKTTAIENHKKKKKKIIFI